MGDFDKKGTSKPSVFNGLEIPRVYILFKEEEIMKKQWLSIVLVLCMVLCMAPATALAAEGETGTLKITVDISGVFEVDNVGDKTFSFEILRKYANYGHYENVDITIKSGETAGTVDVPVEEGKYVVKQTSHATIDGYDWKNASHQPGNNIESSEQEVFADKTKSVTVHNFYKLAVTKEITELPITVTGYALGAKVGDIKASTDQMRVTINKVTIKQRNASDGWDDLASDATIQANTQYAVEIFVDAKEEYTYDELTKDKVTVNGKEASVFENPSTQSGGDMRVFYELEVLEVVKTVESIEITTPPTKTEYMAGEDFDPTGMVVTAHYTDGTTADLSRDKYVIFYGDQLTQGQTDVTIQYNDGSGGSNIKTYQAITVGAYEGPHTHTYGGPWYADAKSHWHQCTDSACPDPSGSTKDLASHTFVWKVDKAATETQTGLKHEECTVCSYKRSENTEIPALRDYAVTVTGGTATVAAGTTITRAMEGVEVTVTADAPKTGKVFDKWVVKAGGVTLANETSATTTFTMPGNDVKIEATYKDAPPSHSVYVGMTYTAGNFIYQITSIDTATLGQSKVIGVVAAKKNKITKVTIPDRADCKGYGLNVTAVGDKAFKSMKKLKKVTFGSNVKVIGKNAFSNCKKLNKISFKNVTTIGNDAFAGCKTLKKLTIGNKVTVIGKNAFKKCSKLKTVVIGKAVKTISSKAFIRDNKIKKITFKGKKLKTVKKNAFSKKAKKNIKSKKTKLKGNKKAIKLFKKKLKIK